ncbi:MAG: glycerophosphodiester phosphodiesterase family protein [Candidatus Borkfalkiaceae bacterium]|nr:glycerophosphodiester phosphodiesterase family protein [Christensenellaceae bacterium]
MKSRINEDFWLMKTPVAHRGLHEDGKPENSLPAFENAIKNGYPIEMDIQLTSDHIPVVFHDDYMERMTGEKKYIRDVSLEDVKKMRLGGTDEGIMTFEEFLNFVDGRVPLVIEYKTQRDKGIIADKTLPLLDKYKGEFVVQSFDPTIVRELRLKRPGWIRGQLICKDRHKNVKWLTDRLLAHGLLNFLSKPDFINMNVKYLPLPRAMKKNRKVISWTIRTEEEKQKAEKYADNYIFEHIRP